MQNKNTLYVSISVAVVIALLIVLTLSFQSSKRTELSFNEKKALLVKENIELKEKLDSIQQQINEKTERLSSAEEEKSKFEVSVVGLKKEFRQKYETSINELAALKRHKTALKKKISLLEKLSLADQLTAAFTKTDNKDLKMVIEDTLKKIDLINSGKSISLEPIIVTKEKGAQDVSRVEGIAVKQSAEVMGAQNKAGIVLKFDPSNSYIVINLGRNEGVKEGDICRVFKDEQEVGSGEVISVRFQIAAVFIDTVGSNNTINDIREGLKVLVEKKQE